jgi:DNA polymerase III subunit delta
VTTPVPAVLVVGDDPYLVSEAVSKALAGIDHLSVEEVSPQEDRARVLQALESTSLFGGRRAVVVRGVDEAPAEVQRSFLAYLKDPNPDCLLVLTTSKSLSGLAEAVRKVGHVVEAARGKRNDLFGWLRDKARELDLRTSGDSMGVLLEAVGEERMALAQALEELSLALGPGGRVTPDAVRRQFKGRGQVNMFGFLDAAATGQTGIALQGLRRLLEQGESAQAILNAVARHFRSMMEVGEGPAGRVAKEMGMHPFRAEKLVKQATAYSPPALAQCYREIAAADRRTKAGEEAEELALERAVVAVTALRGSPAGQRGGSRGE